MKPQICLLTPLSACLTKNIKSYEFLNGGKFVEIWLNSYKTMSVQEIESQDECTYALRLALVK